MISRAARRRLFVFGVWPLFGILFGFQIQISMLTHHHSWARILSYQVLVWSLWIVYAFAIRALLRVPALARFLMRSVLTHVPVALAFGVTHILLWVGSEFVLVPYDFMNPTNFADRFGQVLLFQLPLEVLLYGLVALAWRLDDAAAQARERERRAAQLETSLARARLTALELQTQPHFLFNTLNGIGALVRGNQNAEALAMIGGLSDLLRYALDRAGGGTVTLQEEVGTLERYLEIQRIRFADRLVVEVAVAPDTLRAAVPALLLQPLAENAVRHGIARSESPGRIAVRTRRDGDALAIEIFNTGRLAATRREGIGLSSTTARLAELYGDRARVELAEHDGGVRARVVLPFAEDANRATPAPGR